MNDRHGRSLALAALLVLGACSSDPEATPTSVAPSETDTAPAVRDVWALEPFSRLEPGTYFVDADTDPTTPLRVVYEIPADGWSSWIGAAKFGPDGGHVGVSITTVVNLVTTAVATTSPQIRPSGRPWATSRPRCRNWPPSRSRRHRAT